jgi:hypothetical protein
MGMRGFGPCRTGEISAMLRKEMFLRTAEDHAAHKRRLRVMVACYGVVALAGLAAFTLKPANTSASITIHYPAGTASK